MKKGLFHILLLSMLCVASCHSDPNVSLEGLGIVKDLVVSDSIELEDYDILNPHNIYYAQEMLVFKSRGKNGLQVLDMKNDRAYTMNIIGEGPDEVSMFNIIGNKYSSLFHFVDPNTRKILEFKADTLRVDANYKPRFWMSMSGDTKEVYLNGFENEDFIFYTGHLANGRVLSYNKKTGTVTYSGEFPENDQTALLSQRRKESVFNATIMTGNENHLVACCSGLLDFYEIASDGVLHEITNRHYHFPSFEVNNGNGAVVSFSMEDKVGFTGIDSMGKNVYLLYSNKTFKEFGQKAYNCESILVYDWKGNPLHEYHLEKPLYGFVIAANRIYGLSRENDPKVYIYELNNEG